MSVANMKGDHKTLGWVFGGEKTGQPTVPEANIQVTYLKSTWNPFLVLDDRPGPSRTNGSGPHIHCFGGEWSRHSKFPWRNHWPVTQIPVLGRYAQAADRPAHTYTATQFSAAYETTEKSMTKIMLCGMTDKDAIDLLPPAESWLRAPKMTLDFDRFTNQGYDPAQRAYVISAQDASALRCRIEASTESPIRNLAIVVNDWGVRDATLRLNDQPMPQGKQFRQGHRRRIDGTDLIVWIEHQSDEPVEIELTPIVW